MYCSSCGAAISEDVNTCPACGAPQDGAPGPHSAAGAGAGAVAYQSGVPGPTYLVPSILVTIFCCQIFGIVAIVYAAIAMGKNSSGDYLGARQAASSAKMWCWIGFGIGFAFILLYGVLMVLGVAAGATGSTP